MLPWIDFFFFSHTKRKIFWSWTELDIPTSSSCYHHLCIFHGERITFWILKNSVFLISLIIFLLFKSSLVPWLSLRGYYFSIFFFIWCLPCFLCLGSLKKRLTDHLNGVPESCLEALCLVDLVELFTIKWSV